MRSLPNTVLIICSLLTVGMLSSRSVTASRFMSNLQIRSFLVPPTQIPLEMFELEESGKKTPNRCSSNSTKWGCTAYCGIQFPGTCATGTAKSYPFGNSSTITIGIENHLQNGVQQGYLHNVVPSEMNPQNRNAVAVKAQAIAARTYAYFEITYPTCSDGVTTINNSTEDQVYIPYMYDAQPTNAHKTVVDQAVAQRYYMSYSEPINACGTTIATDQPIFSEFSADVYLATLDHPEQNKYPYMQGVPDPISSHPEVPGLAADSHHRGLSQNGASRWANGNLTSHPAGDKGRWSVQWNDPFQILTHYYTDVHVRDASAGNARKTATDRWLPLKITVNGQEVSALCAGSRYVPLTIWLQNNGINEWVYGYPVVLREHPDALSAAGSLSPDGATTTLVRPGETYTATVSLTTVPTSPAAAYDFYLDMYSFQANRWFSETDYQNPSWPKYKLTLSIVACDKRVYLPALQAGPAAQ